MLRSAPLVPSDLRRALRPLRGARRGERDRAAPRRAGQGRAGHSLPQRCAEAAAVAAARRVGSGGRLLLLLAGRSMAVKVTLPLRRLSQQETGGPSACPRGAAGADAGGGRKQPLLREPRGGPGEAAGGGGDGGAAPGKGQRSLPCLCLLR